MEGGLWRLPEALFLEIGWCIALVAYCVDSEQQLYECVGIYGGFGDGSPIFETDTPKFLIHLF